MEKIKEWFFYYKHKILKYSALTFFALLAFVFIYFHNVLSTRAEEISQESLDIGSSKSIGQVERISTSSEKVKVDIKGQVKKSGIYEVDSNARIMDVIQLAGGLTNDADTSVTNLSKKVFDEMVIIIYNKEQVANFAASKEEQEVKNTACINSDKLENDSCIQEVLPSSTKISLNEATLEQLQTLTGIGQTKAQAIIEYRNTNGTFHDIEEIMNIKGIGQAIFDKIKDRITT